jgi:Domain of unknown function (DUF1707)
VKDGAAIRVADADRERAVEELREHLMAGRLTQTEFEERVESAYAATTRADLDRLVEDLPASRVATKAEIEGRRARVRGRLEREAGGAVAASGAAVAIWAATGADASFWPVWVIVVTGLPVVRNAWRLLGPAPDLDAVEADLNRRRQRRLEREARRERRRPGPPQHPAL